MLDAGLQNQLRAYFTKLRRPVRLVASLNESETAREMKALLKEVAALSELLSYEETLDPSLSRPSFQITSTEREIGIHFAALPMGHEFSSFVLALLQAGGHPVKDESAARRQAEKLSETPSRRKPKRSKPSVRYRDRSALRSSFRFPATTVPTSCRRSI